MELNDVKGRSIVVDANILIHYSSDGFIELSGNPLRILLDNGNDLSVPPIVAFELLSSDNRQEVTDKYLEFLNYVPPIEMQVGYYNNAAHVARLYRLVCNGKKPPLADLLIAGIVSTHTGPNKPLLMTADRNDFCEPIWKTVTSFSVKNTDEKSIRVTFYLLEFNTELAMELLPESKVI